MKNSKISPMNLHEYFNAEGFDAQLDNGTLIPYKFKTRSGGEEERYKVMLPQTPCWCNACNGSGGRSKFDVGGYDIDAMMEDDDDGEFRESYFSGKTDVPCDVCNGSGVMFDIDYESLNDEQKAILKSNSELCYEEAHCRAINDAERRMGA